ncbi:MAG: Chromosome partitioning ATPase, Mrp family, contains Fe-S cluster [Frankiales bacterium]|nr:Chromosome partitioning ATPase, Mrp family, contains Fe-S cluster [Frankiales bacterium]
MTGAGPGRPGAAVLTDPGHRAAAADDVPLPRRRAGVSRRRIVAAVIGGALLGGAAGLGAVSTLTTERAVALLDLTLAVSDGSGSAPTADQADRFVQSELLYLNSNTFERSVLAASPAAAPVTLSAAQVGSTDVIQIVAESSSGDVAVATADASVRVYADHRRALLGNHGAPGVGGTLVESAADAGFQPSLSRTVGVGAGIALGILAGLLLAVLPRLLFPRIWGLDDVADAGGSALRPLLPSARDGWLRALPDRPSGDPLETASRLVAARLAGQLTGRPLVLVGAARGVGTSFAAVNLAAALARRGRTVLIAAGDVAGGQVASWFEVPDGQPSLAGLQEGATLSDVAAALDKTAVENLWLLTAAPSERWETVEAALAGPTIPMLLDDGWTVVVDCPPIELSSAPAELAPFRPVTVVVAAVGATTEEQLAVAADAVPASQGVVPVLVNDKPRRRTRRRVT